MSSKRAQKRRECKRKKSYADQTAAVTDLIKLKRSLKVDSGIIQTYPCPHGGHWHIGHRKGQSLSNRKPRVVRA